MDYGYRRFNAAFTSDLQQFLSWAESNQFLVLIPISLRPILILSSHLRIGLLKDLFPVKILKAVQPSSILTTWSAHLNFLDVITLIILNERYKLWGSLWNLLHSPFSSLFGANICLRILFSNTLCLHSSLNVRDHVSKPYSTTGNIIVSYILIFKFLDRSLDDKSVWTE